MLQSKKILIGITGSIAAYKAILLVRLLVKEGTEVKVIVTPAAKEFVSILTLATLSKNKVLVELSDENTWANHVMLGRWADVMLIAPLSCNTLAKMANGHCDNLLLAAYLSATCPVVVAPAMDEDMWHHPSTKINLNKLIDAGNKVIPVNKGDLASGLFGEGRMAEPEDIILYLKENFFRLERLSNKKAVVTAGPTYEAIDPVRFIGNHSSGKMGFAIAEALYKNGADVTLICGPTNQTTSYKGIKLINVVSAQQMFNACESLSKDFDILVMAAAVADYTPLHVAEEKIKKTSSSVSIELSKTKDILKHFGNIKTSHQFIVGFALETNNERENALIKLKEKNADLLILNSLKDEEAGFGKDTNKVTIFDRKGSEHTFPAKSKKIVAEDIVDIIINKIHELT
jgi:phosphopantothenoylcysteine decarboxylase/phosphopantothenate--cysteine ligase